MMEFILGFVLGLVMTYMVYQWLLMRATQDAKLQVQELMGALEDHAKTNIPARVEHYDGIFYVYNARDNSFMAQGTTMDEIRQCIESRWKEVMVYITEGEEDVIQALKRTRTDPEIDRI